MHRKNLVCKMSYDTSTDSERWAKVSDKFELLPLKMMTSFPPPNYGDQTHGTSKFVEETQIDSSRLKACFCCNKDADEEIVEDEVETSFSEDVCLKDEREFLVGFTTGNNQFQPNPLIIEGNQENSIDHDFGQSEYFVQDLQQYDNSLQHFEQDCYELRFQFVQQNQLKLPRRKVLLPTPQTEKILNATESFIIQP